MIKHLGTLSGLMQLFIGFSTTTGSGNNIEGEFLSLLSSFSSSMTRNLVMPSIHGQRRYTSRTSMGLSQSHLIYLTCMSLERIFETLSTSLPTLDG